MIRALGRSFPAQLRHRATRHPTATVGLLALGLMVPFLGLRPLLDPDEGRYALVAWNMVTSHNFLVPSLWGNPHLSKPPLTYWLVALCLWVFGKSVWAARLPSALAYVASACAVVRISARLQQRQSGAWAGIVWATSLLPFVAGNMLTTDSLLAALTTSAVLCFLTASQEAPPRWCGAGYALALGFAFLTKGPPALLLAFVPLVLWHRLAHRTWLPTPLRRWRLLLLCCAVALGWFILLAIDDPQRLRYWVVEEVLKRLATTEHRRNLPWLMYVAVLVVGLLPWTPFYLHTLWARLRACWRARRPDALSLLYLLWLGIPLLGFSLARSRLPLYVLALAAPLALLAAESFTSRLRAAPLRRYRRLLRLALPAHGLLLLGLVLASSLTTIKDSRPTNLWAQLIARDAGSQRYEVIFPDNFINPSLLFYKYPHTEIVTLASTDPEPMLESPRLETLEEELRERGEIWYLVVRREDLDEVVRASPYPISVLYLNPRFALLKIDPNAPW